MIVGITQLTPILVCAFQMMSDGLFGVSAAHTAATGDGRPGHTHTRLRDRRFQTQNARPAKASKSGISPRWGLLRLSILAPTHRRLVLTRASSTSENCYPAGLALHAALDKVTARGNHATILGVQGSGGPADSRALTMSRSVPGHSLRRGVKAFIVSTIAGQMRSKSATAADIATASLSSKALTTML